MTLLSMFDVDKTSECSGALICKSNTDCLMLKEAVRCKEFP
jgi:hypothetical protein